MINESYVDRLVNRTPVRYYVSGIDGARARWPWRMCKASAEASERYVSACDHFVLDSNFSDDSVTNLDVLDEAARLGADVAVLADVYHDADATINALRDGLQIATEHQFNGTLILPLQPPHDESYGRLVADAPDDVWWAVGGVKDAPATEKVRAAHSLRRAAGPDAWIHGLGMGPTAELVQAIRSEPQLLDSLDNSSAVQDAQDGSIAAGDERMTVVAARATARRLETLRELAGISDDGESHQEVGLEAFRA